MKIRTGFMVAALALLICGVGVTARAAEEKEEKGEKKEKKEAVAPKLTLEKLPVAVKATALKELKGGKLTDIEKETEDGKTQYVVELTKGKEKFEIAITENGKVASREQLITLKQAPKAVRAALKQEAKGGTLGEEIEKGELKGKPVYTANVTKGKKAYEVIFSEDGKLVKREAATEVKESAKKAEKDDDEKDEKDEKVAKAGKKAEKDDDEKDEKDEKVAKAGKKAEKDDDEKDDKDEKVAKAGKKAEKDDDEKDEKVAKAGKKAEKDDDEKDEKDEKVAKAGKKAEKDDDEKDEKEEKVAKAGKKAEKDDDEKEKKEKK